MDLNLRDKVAFITGASSGIGAACAVIFAEEGTDTILGYCHNRGGAQETQRLIRQYSRQSWLCQMDLAQAASIQSAVQSLVKVVPHIDILVLCAGCNIVTPIDQITLDEWAQIININLNGVFYTIQAVKPMLRHGGAVVTVSSVAAHTGAPHHAHYAAAKAGLVNLTKSLAREMAPDIRVNCVAPGISLTPMGIETVSNLAPNYAKENLLLQRFATPDEIARCVVFLASPAASFVTGATLDVNGGRYLR